MTIKIKPRLLFRVFLLCSVLTIQSCESKPKVEKISPDIPKELQGVEEAEHLISEMSDVVFSIRKNMAKAAAFAIAQEKSDVDSLTVKQGLKVGVIAARMMLSQKKMEEIKEEVLLLKPGLSEQQCIALDGIMADLESSVGDINPEALGLSEEELAQLKAGDDLQFGDAESLADQRVSDSLNALRDEAIAQMKAEGNYEEPEASNAEGKDVPLWISIAFPIFVLGLMIFMLVFTIKRVVKKIKGSAGDFSFIKNEINKRIK